MSARAGPGGAARGGACQDRAVRVTDIMTRPVRTVAPDAPIAAVVRVMLDDRCGSVVVVDGGEPARGVVGIVTRTDLQLATRRVPLGYPDVRAPSLLDEFVADDEQLQRAYRRARTRPVSEVMSRPVVTIGSRSTVWEAAELMLAERIGHVPVVDERAPVGIVSRLDLLRCMALD